MKFSNCVQCAAKTCQGNDTRLTDFEGIKKDPRSGPLKNLEREKKIRTCSECRRVSAFAQLFSGM